MVCLYCRSAFSIWCQRQQARIRLHHDAINVTEITTNKKTVVCRACTGCAAPRSSVLHPADHSMEWLLHTRRNEAMLAHDHVLSIHGLCSAEATLTRLLMHENRIILVDTNYEAASCSCHQGHANTTSVRSTAFHLHTATKLSSDVANQELLLFC